MSGKKEIIWDLWIKPETSWAVKSPGRTQSAHSTPLTDILGRPYIPASTLKGKLRHSFQRICSTLGEDSRWLEELFGTEGNGQGRLYIYDAYMIDDNVQWKEQRVRIAINRKLRVVHDQSLLSEELIKPKMVFKTTMRCYATDDEIQPIISRILLALYDLSSLGGGRSIGRGRISFRKGGQSKVEISIDHQQLSSQERERYIQMEFGRGGLG